nr:Na+ dependent nucleoside transporter N-terminal domain-containing protein [Streptomyces sp. HP-A2021]
MYSDIGLGVVKWFAAVFGKLLGFAGQGTDFVFGGMVNGEKNLISAFFFKVTLPYRLHSSADRYPATR